ncbi:MAG: TetR/AcrR family transcriptional regulator [Acidimicrobiales bacterium]
MVGGPEYCAAQARIITAATELFSERGVGGTSLQMIADALGVTKAAVYHQFKTKEEIVIAVAEAELDKVEAAIGAAESEPNRDRARDVLVTRMVDLGVAGRHMESALVGDPVIVRFFAGHKRHRQVMGRPYRLLARDEGDPDGRLSAAMLTAAIGGAVMHPLVAELSDDALRSQLLRLARRFLGLPA